MLEPEVLELEEPELEPGLALVALALEAQVVGPVAVIQQGIIRRQVEQLLERRRRDRPDNQHQQGASSSDPTARSAQDRAAMGRQRPHWTERETTCPRKKNP